METNASRTDSKMKALTRIVADHRPQAFQQFSAFDH